jgi:hypothetical protein
LAVVLTSWRRRSMVTSCIGTCWLLAVVLCCNHCRAGTAAGPMTPDPAHGWCPHVSFLHCLSTGLPGAYGARTSIRLSGAGASTTLRYHCKEDDECPQQEYCSEEHCASLRPDGSSCRGDGECRSGVCQHSWWPPGDFCRTL